MLVVIIHITKWLLVIIINGCVWKKRKPLNPMVFMIIIPIRWLFVWEYILFSDKPKWLIDVSW